MNDKPVITVVHELPGRLRLRLSHSPRELERLQERVKDHEGIELVHYNPVVKSVLVKFNTQFVTREEIIIRIAMSISLDYDTSPVQLFSQPVEKEISWSASSSGILLLLAFLFRILNTKTTSSLWTDRIASGATAMAVVEHGWEEVQSKGNFDPEVLSVVYLLTSLLKGNSLPAAMFTWITTFGRHIFRQPEAGVELKLIEIGKGDNGSPSYEVVVTSLSPKRSKISIINVLPAMASYLVTGSMSGSKNLMNEIQRVSQLHGQVLEGLGELRDGIPLRIQ